MAKTVFLCFVDRFSFPRAAVAKVAIMSMGMIMTVGNSGMSQISTLWVLRV